MRPRAAETIYGVHPVLEALQARRRSIERILVAREAGGGKMGRLFRLAREADIPITHLPRAALARRVGTTAAHQGVAAVVSALPYAAAAEVCRQAARLPDGLLLMLDRVVDPGNLGAILRSAVGAGAHGVLLAGEGTVGLTPAVAKASAGAVERIPVAREPRPRRRLEGLRSTGFSLVALEPGAPEGWDRPGLRGRVLLLAGGEERGLRKGLAEVCDARVAIPLTGELESLNVSVALGILLFEAVRQRRAGQTGGP